jgi:hypothetical protein
MNLFVGMIVRCFYILYMLHDVLSHYCGRDKIITSLHTTSAGMLPADVVTGY